METAEIACISYKLYQKCLEFKSKLQGLFEYEFVGYWLSELKYVLWTNDYLLI